MSGKSVRLNLLVHPSVRALFESLRERMGADSFTEILRRAVATFDWLVALHERGASLSAELPDGTIEEGPDPRRTSVRNAP